MRETRTPAKESLDRFGGFFAEFAMKNLTVRPDYPRYDGRRNIPPPKPPKDVARFAGEAFNAMKAMQDQYGRNIPATYAERETVDDLKEEVRTLSDKEREFSLTGDEIAIRN